MRFRKAPGYEQDPRESSERSSIACRLSRVLTTFPSVLDSQKLIETVQQAALGGTSSGILQRFRLHTFINQPVGHAGIVLPPAQTPSLQEDVSFLPIYQTRKIFVPRQEDSHDAIEDGGFHMR